MSNIVLRTTANVNCPIANASPARQAGLACQLRGKAAPEPSFFGWCYFGCGSPRRCGHCHNQESAGCTFERQVRPAHQAAIRVPCVYRQVHRPLWQVACGIRHWATLFRVGAERESNDADASATWLYCKASRCCALDSNLRRPPANSPRWRADPMTAAFDRRFEIVDCH